MIDLEKLEFTLKRTEKTVKLENPDGTVSNYTLKELTGEERDKYLSGMAKKMKTGPDGKPIGLRDFEGIEADLIFLSLYDEKGKNVPTATIAKYPSRVQRMLFQAAQKLSGLDETAEEEAKNV